MKIVAKTDEAGIEEVLENENITYEDLTVKVSGLPQNTEQLQETDSNDLKKQYSSEAYVDVKPQITALTPTEYAEK